MTTINAYQIKPLDGLPSGTVRSFDSGDFGRLKALGAVREATEEEVKAAPGYLNKMAPAVLNKGADIQRDLNGDTPEMAEMRRMFDASYKRQGDALVLAQGEVTKLTGEIADLNALIKAQDEELAELKALGGSGGGQGSTGADNGSSEPPATYSVTDKGSGWFVISQDGKEVTKSLRKDAVDGFAELDADKQIAFVEANLAD